MKVDPQFERNDEPLWGMDAVAQYLGISISTVYEYLNRHSKYYKEDFPKRIKVGRLNRFYPSEVRAYARLMRMQDALDFVEQ